jgi:hypothetical protein
MENGITHQAREVVPWELVRGHGSVRIDTRPLAPSLPLCALLVLSIFLTVLSQPLAVWATATRLDEALSVLPCHLCLSFDGITASHGREMAKNYVSAGQPGLCQGIFDLGLYHLSPQPHQPVLSKKCKDFFKDP